MYSHLRESIMNAFMHLMDDHLVTSFKILHIYVIFWNFYNIYVIF
jgi:hypothetical protein